MKLPTILPYATFGIGGDIPAPGVRICGDGWDILILDKGAGRVATTHMAEDITEALVKEAWPLFGGRELK